MNGTKVDYVDKYMKRSLNVPFFTELKKVTMGKDETLDDNGGYENAKYRDSDKGKIVLFLKKRQLGEDEDITNNENNNEDEDEEYMRYMEEKFKKLNFTDDLLDAFNQDFFNKGYNPNKFLNGQIAFVLPKEQKELNGDKFIDNVMNHPQIRINNNITPIKMNSEEEVFSYFNNNQNSNKLLAAVIFHENYYNYSIRINSKYIIDPKTKPVELAAKTILGKEKCFNDAYDGCISDASVYQVGFTPLQIAVDSTIISLNLNDPSKGIINKYIYKIMNIFNSPKDLNVWEEDNEKKTYTSYVPLIPLIFIAQLFHLSSRIMEEKESGIKEGLIAIGARRSLFWFSWEIIYFPVSVITILFIMVLNPLNMFSYISPLLFFVHMLLYAVSIYQLIVIFTYFFKKSSTYTIFLIVFFIFVMIINKIMHMIKFNGFPIIENIVSLLFSPTNFCMAHTIINAHFVNIKDTFIKLDLNKSFSSYEFNKITFSTMFQSSFGKYFIYLIGDIVLYFFITFFFDWMEGSGKYSSSTSRKVKSMSKTPYAQDIQQDPVNAECSVQVKDITKFFKQRKWGGKNKEHVDEGNGKIFAANNHISFNVYKNEIFAILGHNGAGKSTLIQNMVGIQKPNGGETFYDGLPISKSKSTINSKLGICLQSNVLFKYFTPVDHYIIYAGIKGIKVSKEGIDQWLREVDLYDKKNFIVDELSGGQKRKLCIGLAFMGNPKYVFLDEPTTGLDPLSRRKIWNLLQEKKKDRVIFITTHYMDEADIVADRKLILNKGVIRCMGSSVYLKSHFHMKYSLEVEMSGDPYDLDKLIKHYIPEAEYFNNKTAINNTQASNRKNNSNDMNNSNGKTVIHINPINGQGPQYSCFNWRLPIHSSSVFPKLFDCLENEKNNGRIHEFSINAPMLEELFVQLERENENKENKEKSNAIELPNVNNTKRPGTWNMAFRIAQYRIRTYYRNLMYIAIGIVIPIIFSFGIFYLFNLTLNTTFNKSSVKKDVSESITFTPEIYKDYQWNYITNSTTMNKLTSDILKQQLPSDTTITNIPESEIMNIRNIDANAYSYKYGYDNKLESETNIPENQLYISSFSGEIKHNNILIQLAYNDSLVHGLPVTINTISNSILKSYGINKQIQVSSKPLEIVNMDVNEIDEIRYYTIIIILVCIGLTLSFYGTNAVHERVIGLFKQLQLNGVTDKSYWIATFFTDYIFLIITVILILLVGIIIRFVPFTNILLPGVVIIYVMVYGIACLLLQYSFCFIFTKENRAFIVYAIINLLITSMLMFISNWAGLDDDYSENIVGGSFLLSKERIERVTKVQGIIEAVPNVLFPNYGIIRIFKNVIIMGLKHEYYNTPISFSELLDTKNFIVIEFGCAVASSILWFFIFMIIERRNRRPSNKFVCNMTKEIEERFKKQLEEGDDDVKLEYEKVMADKVANIIPLKMEQYTKEHNKLKFKTGKEMHDALSRENPKYGQYHISKFGTHRVCVEAYRNISLGVDRCECFGLLGPNGSGKSSLLNTAALCYQPTLGHLYYDGKDMNNRKTNSIPIGYCPQIDTVWDDMTLCEHIEMFLYIQGYSKSESKKLALQYIDYCRLTSHKNKYPSELSGGTLRKLNILISLCCNSSIILLDEPTAGMDPSTRRYVWDMFKSTIQTRQSSTIMSTHSMEEAELLCNRIGIMINGTIRCIGSPEHLKMKFGNTYILDVQTNDVERFHQVVVDQRNIFQGQEYTREDKSLERVKYEVKCDSRNSGRYLSRVFRIMEESRVAGLISDYSFSKSSLEQVFLNFAILKELETKEDNEKDEKSIFISIDEQKLISKE